MREQGEPLGSSFWVQIMRLSAKKNGPGLPWGDVEPVNERLDSTQDQTSSNEGGNVDQERLSWSDHVSRTVPTSSCFGMTPCKGKEPPRG